MGGKRVRDRESSGRAGEVRAERDQRIEDGGQVIPDAVELGLKRNDFTKADSEGCE
jgi:hypothetical protein